MFDLLERGYCGLGTIRCLILFSPQVHDIQSYFFDSDCFTCGVFFDEVFSKETGINCYPILIEIGISAL